MLNYLEVILINIGLNLLISQLEKLNTLGKFQIVCGLKPVKPILLTG